MEILILTAKFGMGHYSASHSLKQQIQDKIPGTTVSIIDFFDYTAPKASTIMYKSFDFMINRASTCYNLFYRLSEKGILPNSSYLIDYFMGSLQQLIDETNPKLIISTVPFCSQLLSHYTEQSHHSVPFVTCITDISSHCEWIHKNTSYYLVASPSIKDALIKKGVTPDRIQINGIPVRREFLENCDSLNHIEPPRQKRLLIMGGGLGLLPKSPTFYEALNDLDSVTTTVITGNNKRLFNQIHQKYNNIEVIGYTNQVYKFMQEADLIISKPGGITVFEAINSEIPILVFEPFLQQEINNANFIRLHNLGGIIHKKQIDSVEVISNFIYDSKALQQIKLNMKHLKKQFNDHALEQIILSIPLGECAS